MNPEQAQFEIEALQRRLAEYAGEVQRLREALKPFVAEFKRWLAHSGRNSTSRRAWNQKMPDAWEVRLKVTMGDCRNAVAATKEPESTGTQLAAEVRAETNNLSVAEREEAFKRGMRIIYGSGDTVPADKARVIAEALRKSYDFISTAETFYGREPAWITAGGPSLVPQLEADLDLARELGLLGSAMDKITREVDKAGLYDAEEK